VNKQEFKDFHAKMGNIATTVMKAKNEDYAHGNDPFANFRGSLFIDVDPKLGVLLRMMDKIRRLQAFALRGNLKVKEESVTDAVVDIVNYAIIFGGMCEEEKNDGQAA